jgi:hypothetical protein
VRQVCVLDGSGVNREVHAPFCERPEVQFLRPTCPLLLETFVDPRHYTGTCYRAAGWQLLGATSGRGLARPGQSYRSTPRQVWLKPLSADCRDRLCAAPGNSRP